MMITQRNFYSGQAYYRLRPGITGNWQVSARNDSEFVSRANFDTVYDGEVSLVTDLKFFTAPSGSSSARPAIEAINFSHHPAIVPRVPSRGLFFAVGDPA